MKATTLEHSKNTPFRGVIMMLISVIGFTVNSLLLRYIGNSGSDISFMLPLFFRAAVGTIVVLTIFRGARPTQVKPVFTDPKLIVRGLLGLIGTAAYYWTIPAMGAGKATLLCNTYIIFAAVIAAICLKEKLGLEKIGLLVVGLVGIALLSGPSESVSHSFAFGVNEAVALVGAVFSAAVVVLIRRLINTYSSGTIFLAQCIWILVPTAFLTLNELPNLSSIDWVLLTGAASMAALGQLTMNEGYRCLTVATGAPLQMLWPVFAAIGSLVWFDERFLPIQLVGAGLILIGNVVGIRRSN